MNSENQNPPNQKDPNKKSTQTSTSQQQGENQSTLKKIRRAWNNFEVRMIKAADSSKVDPRKVSVNSSSNTAEFRQQEVSTKSVELIKARLELRNLLNEAEANVKDNAKEFKALNLMSRSSGYCIGRKRRRKC